MGPSAPRIVSKQMPSKAPSVLNFTAEADLFVHSDGEVGTINIVTSSGDAEFDKQWKKSMSYWRFVPSVDAAGQPQQSTVHVIYKDNVLNIGGAVSNPVGDSERISKMTCKDFDWEYRIVTDSLARRFALLDPLLKTPKIMLIAENNLGEAQVAVLNEKYDDVLSNVARQCRDNPGNAFWKEMLKPALETALIAQ